MAFKDFFKRKPKDPFDTTGLEAFSPKQQERILSRIGNKESDILDQKAELEVKSRIAQLEKSAGIVQPTDKKENIRTKLQAVKDFRQRNLERRIRNVQKQKQLETDFRAGRLAIKPVGPPRKDPTQTVKTGSIVVKEIKLKSPPRGLK